MKPLLQAALVCAALTGPASGLDGPWISDTFFYWYTWDYEQELGGWMGGVHNTPLDGYYDSLTFRDNRRSLWQASEWGLTHHFMDYWDPNWKGEGGERREAIVMRAAESLRKDGYDIWMAYYQDGHNFEMREFSRNVSEKRDVHQWLRDFAKSEVWPKIAGEPLQLVYSRNGRPKTTIDHDGFRRFLARRYKTIAALNRAWGTSFRGLEEIEMAFAAEGHQRAESIEYQYQTWQREWQKLNSLVKQEFGLPGMRASFDVGYKPYMGFGFANFARVFGGPHSYGGIFSQPDDQDAQRFIQAAVAKSYGTVFFDHFKNFYFDWGIRIPGTAYLPEPCHFDRFWVGALARHSEALLHLSWNEWWEGSNLEPCYEYGKTYCEKNLFYATLMKLAFESIRAAGRGAPVGVILNDWRLLTGAEHIEELYGTIQTLRRLNVPFELLPDDGVTADRLKGLKLVVAPAFACGLGYNAQREPILDVLAAWLKSGDRRLIVSGHRSVARAFGLQEAEPAKAGAATRGDDLNVFVDVGAEGDTEFLRSGYAGRENWGRLPKGAFGAGTQLTVRWTPAVGRVNAWLLPASPNRDHVLRFGGRSIWPNRVTVLVNGRAACGVDIPAGSVDAQAPVPAGVIGSARMVKVQLRYAEAHVPMKKAPKRYKTESRVCNVAMDYLQWSTANVPANTRTQQYSIPQETIRLTGSCFGDARDKTIRVPFQARPCLTAPGVEALSEASVASAPRDLSLRFGPAKALYVNGPLSEIESSDYWLPLLREWAGVRFDRFAAGEHCMTARLSAGDTDFVVCFNEDIAEPRDLRLSIPGKAAPLSEATVLVRDRDAYQPLSATTDGGMCVARDTLRYFGVYQFAFAPVRVRTPRLAMQPGETKVFPVEVTNLTPKPVRGAVRVASVIPTITGKPARVALGPTQTQTISMPITAARTADWGRKTVYLELAFNGRRAVVLRDLVIQKPPEVEVADAILDAAKPEVELVVPGNPYGETAALANARLTFDGRTVPLPAIAEAGRSRESLPAPKLAAAQQPVLQPRELVVGEPAFGRQTQREVFLAVKPTTYRGPSSAQAALVVFNARSTALDHELLSVRVPSAASPGCVRTDEGVPLPSQSDVAGSIRFLANVPARGGRAFYLCSGEAQVRSDLRVTADHLGTGRGVLKVENSHLRLTLSEAAGGTLTRMESACTGRDYGRRSFGINYGTFSQHDPKKPRTTTVDHIHETKVRQEDAPGRIAIVSQGPAAVVARVTWADENVQVEQTYEFRAYQPFFVLSQKVTPVALQDKQELVAVNAQFRPNRLTKTYPSFVGVRKADEQPHFGWRQGAWVPEYATLMQRDGFDESVSLIITRKKGLTGIRQGFWPKERPKSGPCDIAQVELLADRAAGCDAQVYVLVHKGHQVVAKRFLADRRARPRVEVVTDVRWAGRTTPADPPSEGWYSPFWRYRLPLQLSEAAAASAGAAMHAGVDLAGLAGKPIDPGSVRVICRMDDGTVTELAAGYSAESKRLAWRMLASPLVPGCRIHVYFDSADRGPKARSWLAVLVCMAAISDETFDGSRAGWLCSSASFEAGQGHAGSVGVALKTTAQHGLSLLSHHLITADPDSTYAVRLSAKTSTPGVALRTNFYADAKFDFPQVAIPLKADGQWHRYETQIATKASPPHVQPYFRLWLVGKPATVLVDDISVTPLGAAQAAAAVTFGGLATYP